jgi:N-carbamoylputrescine amidase
MITIGTPPKEDMMQERIVKIALIQGEAYGDPASTDVAKNRAYYVDLVAQACRDHKPDIILLPEVFTTPYFCSSHDPAYFGLAETIPGPTTAALSPIAREYGAHIFAPVFERVIAGEFYDSCALIGPDGALLQARVAGSGATLQCARKVHIPNIDANGTRTDEKFWFRPGQGLVTFDTSLGRLGCLICYDRSFPEAWRTLVLAGAEAIFVPVASYGFREEMFLVEMRTRAAENGVFAVACNRAGRERVGDAVTMFGDSCVIAPNGDVLAVGASGKGPETIVAEIDLALLDRSRVEVPYLRDRRPELYAL